MAKRAPPTIGSIIDQLHTLREEKKDLESKVKAKEKEIEDAKLEFITRANAEGMKACTGSLASATINEKVVPQVVDWDSFYQYIYENRFFHLLQRRPSVIACQELFDGNTVIPGVEKFTKVEVNLRSL